MGKTQQWFKFNSQSHDAINNEQAEVVLNHLKVHSPSHMDISRRLHAQASLLQLPCRSACSNALRQGRIEHVLVNRTLYKIAYHAYKLCRPINRSQFGMTLILDAKIIHYLAQITFSSTLMKKPEHFHFAHGSKVKETLYSYASGESPYRSAICAKSSLLIQSRIAKRLTPLMRSGRNVPSVSMRHTLPLPPPEEMNYES